MSTDLMLTMWENVIFLILGCTSWEWFYPYHYGPFLQDMTQLSTVPAYADTVKLGNCVTFRFLVPFTLFLNNVKSLFYMCVLVNLSSGYAMYVLHFISFHSNTCQMSVLITSMIGNPLQPFQQLLACLPAASSGLLPAPYHALMNDATSPLHGFYPTGMHSVT